MAVIRHRRDAV